MLETTNRNLLTITEFLQVLKEGAVFSDTLGVVGKHILNPKIIRIVFRKPKRRLLQEMEIATFIVNVPKLPRLYRDLLSLYHYAKMSESCDGVQDCF